MKEISLIILCLCVLQACDQKQLSHFRIMSYNIKHGEGMDNILDLSRAAQIIKKETPDFCALQEIDNDCLRSNNVRQTDYLSEITSMTGTFGKFMDFQGGEYGMATLSSKPVVSTKLLQLPDGLHEPRSSIIHELEIAPRCTIVVANVHFDWIGGDEGSSSRLNQAKVLLEYIDMIDRAVIIIGDFNCTPESPTMNYYYDNGFEFADKGTDRLSFQGTRKAEIDHVIFRNTKSVKIETINLKLLDEPIVSDHRPLIADLKVIY